MDYLFIVVLIIPAIAQAYVSSTYHKYLNVKSDNNLTGYDIAKMILDKEGLSNLYVVETKGTMTDHYDSSRKIVRLSTDVYRKDCISSVAIAAHECGHAIQDKEGYFFLKVRSFIYPVVNVATKFSYVILLVAFLLRLIDLIPVGIFLLCFGLVFQLITLPVEFNASKRALVELKELGLVSDDKGIRSMLRSAALTYVASVLASALEILRLLSLLNRRR